MNRSNKKTSKTHRMNKSNSMHRNRYKNRRKQIKNYDDRIYKNVDK